MDTSLFDAFSLLLLRNQKYMHRLLGEWCSQIGLNYSSIVCIRIIMGCPDGLSASEICETGCYDKALISRTVKELTAKGYVCRHAEDEDLARGYRIVLTEKGKNLAHSMEDDVFRFAQEITKDIPQEEMRQFYDISVRLSENLRRLTKIGVKPLDYSAIKDIDRSDNL